MLMAAFSNRSSNRVKSSWNVLRRTSTTVTSACDGFHVMESRTATILSSLDNSVFDVVSNLGLSHQIELSVAIASFMVEFDHVAA